MHGDAQCTATPSAQPDVVRTPPRATTFDGVDAPRLGGRELRARERSGRPSALRARAASSALFATAGATEEARPQRHRPGERRPLRRQRLRSGTAGAGRWRRGPSGAGLAAGAGARGVAWAGGARYRRGPSRAAGDDDDDDNDDEPLPQLRPGPSPPWPASAPGTQNSRPLTAQQQGAQRGVGDEDQGRPRRAPAHKESPSIPASPRVTVHEPPGPPE